ncbi:hypothetical protein [Leifsonia poae]|uniref:hypothetical protein n=1 Tax=Leifsonia poae TaxID=110933 RepID=UPI001CBDF7BD|nr:hypothetical protein [Leifsonia poae]
MDDARDEKAIDGIRVLLRDAVERLDVAGARDEGLAVFVPRHRRMLVTREAVLRPAGRVWRLGVLLLDRSGSLHATGSITRAAESNRPTFQSVSAETRRELRVAAVRGHFAVGETVNYDAPEIDLSAAGLRGAGGPLVLRDGVALVRWSPAAFATVPFGPYLAERVSLLTDPPQGA